MTKEESFQWARMAGFSIAEIEEAAATANMTSQELIEFVVASAPKMLEKMANRHLGAPRNAVVTQVSGNVIQVNFSARAAASWSDRASYQGRHDRRASGSRLRLIPITVPSTSPNSHAAPVSSTSPDTVIPYSS